MIPATSTPRGLAHATFLERHARQSPETSLDARLAQAAFLALRLVDRLGADREAAHCAAFHYQYVATDRLCRRLPAHSETGHVSALVRSAWDAFQEEDVRLAVPALLAYAHYLEDELRLEEALDVLETLLKVGGERLRSSDAIAAHLRIGRVNRKLNRFDEADRAYGVAGELAYHAADAHAALLSRVGRAISTQTKGNLAEAERLFRELAVDARAVGARDIEAHSHHALGTTLALRGHVDEAAVTVWQAFQLYEDESSRMRALKDLGTLLLALGHVVDAERALGEVVRRGGARDNVANALIELMHCASYRRDRVGFERLRAHCGSRMEDLPPNILADFYLKAGIGSARFGNFAKARALMVQAASIAKMGQLHELEFRVERILAGLRDCESEAANMRHRVAEPAIRMDELQEVSASLARLQG